MTNARKLTTNLRDVFPHDFLWGASVSAHQVDGSAHSQWTAWEKRGAEQFAKEAEGKWSKLPGWETIAQDAKQPKTYMSGMGVAHRKKYKQDLELLKSIGLTSFRFSIEWSEIEPEEGVFDLQVIAFYRRYIEDIIRMGIEPVITLWHWTAPQWFVDKGDFTKHRNLVYWRRFIEKLADELPWNDSRYVITLNEPNTYIGMSYAIGEFPPGKKNPLLALKTYWVLTQAHREAYRVLKSRFPHLQLSPAVQVNAVIPANPKSFVDKSMVRAEEYFYWWFYKRCKHFDYIAMNHYFTDIRDGFSLLAKQPQPHNDMGFYMDPYRLRLAIRRAHQKLKKPILVAENGVADREDKYRLWWLTETMHALSDVQTKDAVPLIGYIHWSLLDNFEWQYGWLQKFGLFEVNLQTYERHIRKSTKAWKSWLLHK